jgi:hypothetical protein
VLPPPSPPPPPPILIALPRRYGALAMKFAKKTGKLETKIRALGRLIRREKQQVGACPAALAE